MPTIDIHTTYDSATRELRTVSTLTGFVSDLPDKAVISTQVDSLSLTGVDVLAASDLQRIQVSSARSVRTANGELVQWSVATANADKSGELLASTIDPVSIFDAALLSSEDAGGPTVDAVAIFDSLLNPST